VAHGCDSVPACEFLTNEARQRAAKCDKGLSAPPCADAQKDLTDAEALLEREHDSEAALATMRAQKVREDNARSELQRQRVAESKRRAADDEEARRRTAEEAERTAKEMEAEADLDEVRQKEDRRLSLLDRSGRERELRQCYRASALALCRDLLDRLLSLASTEAEKKALVGLDQTLSGQASGAANSGMEGMVLQCCDGSTSGCACDGPHRGCCSHHGGVCGCHN
jgi:hypothetical protein